MRDEAIAAFSFMMMAIVGAGIAYDMSLTGTMLALCVCSFLLLVIGAILSAEGA